MTVAPAFTEVAPSVFVICRLAIGLTVSRSEAELLPEAGSVVPEGAATVAVLVTDPVVAVTLVGTVIS